MLWQGRAMAPKKLNTKGSASSGSTPQKSDRPQLSNRPPASSRNSSRKKVLSTKDKLDALEEDKKVKAKAKAKRDAPEVILEVDLEELEPLEQLTAPLQAVIADLRGQLSAAQQQEFELGEFELRDGSAPPEAAAVPAPAPAPSAPTMKHEKAVSIWRDAAADGLAKMGSSLHGALMSDTKLREIFDHIDMDKGGTIDKNELRIALEGAGKNLSDQAITAMMNAADNDSNGEIEFEEFANIMKGVKANSAASTIGRKVRARQQSSKAKTKKGVTEVAKSKALDRRSLDRAVGEALLARKSNPQELVREWDRKQKGAINRIEFRQGCRESLGLNFDNKDLDEWFDKIDADKGGTIDVSELKTALRMLQEKAVSDQRVREELGARMVALKAKIAAMDALLDVTSAALNAVSGSLLWPRARRRHYDASRRALGPGLFGRCCRRRAAVPMAVPPSSRLARLAGAFPPPTSAPCPPLAPPLTPLPGNRRGL